jgi:prepilin-type N-terminal cleavage/methylation domain-containing protein
MMRTFYMHSAQCGHTLIELVAVISIAGVIAGVIAPPLVAALTMRRSVAVRGALLQEGRSAMERLSRELRQTPCDAASADAPGITLATTAAIDCTDQSFRFNDNALERRAAGNATWYPLARHVSTAAFTYYDQDGNVLGATPLSVEDRAKVRRISSVVTFSYGNETLQLRTGVYLRYFAFRGM